MILSGKVIKNRIKKRRGTLLVHSLITHKRKWGVFFFHKGEIRGNMGKRKEQRMEQVESQREIRSSLLVLTINRKLFTRQHFFLFFLKKHVFFYFHISIGCVCQ